MNKKKLSWQWILAAIMVLGFGVIVSLLSQSRFSREPTSLDLDLTLGVETSLLTAAIWVAEDQSFFRDEGLNVTIMPFDSGRLSFLAMLNGEVDVSTVAPTPIMFSSFDRDDFSIFATMVYSDDDVKVIARADLGIKTAKDLLGKRVGTPAGTTGQFFLNAFLIFNGIPASGISEISLNPSQLPGALESGKVDAIVIWEPHAHMAKKRLENKAAQLRSSEVYRETFNLMVMKAYAKDNAQLLERLLRSIDKATSYIQNNKLKAQEIISRRLQLDKEETAALWDDFNFDISLDKSLLVTLEDEARWAINNNLTEQRKVPDYLDFIYSVPLKKVKPQAVTLIQ